MPHEPDQSLFALVSLPDAPSIPGLTFRLFRGEADRPALEAVRQEGRAVDGDIWLPGPDTDPHPACNPSQDCLVAEIAGRMVAYTWLDWWKEVDGTQLYLHLGWVVPQVRRLGIGQTLLHWQERRLCYIANAHQRAGPCLFGGNADETQPANCALLLSEGYQVAFTCVDMICHLTEAPLHPTLLPDGLLIRPVEEEHLFAIYTANDEAFRDSHQGYTRESSEDFLRELHWPQTDTSLWFVAWEGNQVAGLVISEIDEAGGHTPWVAVARPWRRRGLARALMTHTL